MASNDDVMGQEGWRIFRIMAEFVEGFEQMSRVKKGVSIFGSARTRPTDPYFKAAEETGRLLAKAGYAVITGGGPGIMEAGNKGAFDAGGQSIGLNISLPQEQESNRYQTLSLNFHYFYARKVMFVKYATAFICFPGGYGTLDEFFETITLIQTLKITPFPVVLYGTEHWHGLVEWMRKKLAPHFIDGEDVDIFRLADRPKDAVELIREAHKSHWWHPHAKGTEPMLQPHKGSTPLESATTSNTGEGTRYGTRPRKSTAKHAKPRGKPAQ